MYKKIDIYLKDFTGFLKDDFCYECSTIQSKTCKEAKEKFLKKEYYLDKTQVKAYFSK